MKKQNKSLSLDENQRSNETKKVYEPPVLKEHGDAKEVTLQTFFGTFSPGNAN